MKHTRADLLQMQSLPLEAKIRMTQERIKVWYESWKRFEIKKIKKYNKKGEPIYRTRFVTMDCRDVFAEPELKEGEYISRVFDGQVYVSFSGGKDSTVLLHLVREMYPDVEAVFVDTGLEYPEIRQFVKTFDNVTILRPEMGFVDVIKKYGYPVISKEVSAVVSEAKIGLARNDGSYKYRIEKITGTGKYTPDENGKKSRYDVSRYKPLLDVDFNVSDRCCKVMKKQPARSYARKIKKIPILATMASESDLRYQRWIKYGCNAFDAKGDNISSNPMSFWTEQDVLQYIKKYNIPIASVYGSVEYREMPEQMRLEDYGFEECGIDKLETTGCNRTGCIFCGFGCHLEKEPNRFQLLKETHPRQYAYCIGGGEYNENGVWQPNKTGLGLGHVFDELNKIYGDDFIKY